MAASPPVVMPEEKMPRKVSGNWLRMSGTSSTLRPNEKLTAMTKVAFRPMGCAAMMRMPAAATVPNISNVAPPSTGSGNQRKDKPDGRKQSQYHQKGSNIIAHVTAGHARKLNHPVILRKDGIGKRIEHACQHGVEPVGQNASRGTTDKLLTLYRFARNERVGRNVAVSLDSRNQEYQSQCDERRQTDVQPVTERHRHIETSITLYGREVYHPHRPRHHITDKQPDNNGTHAQVTVTTTVEENDKHQHQCRQPYVTQRAKGAIGLCHSPSPTGCDAHLDKAHAYESHHDA